MGAKDDRPWVAGFATAGRSYCRCCEYDLGAPASRTTPLATYLHEDRPASSSADSRAADSPASPSATTTSRNGAMFRVTGLDSGFSNGWKNTRDCSADSDSDGVPPQHTFSTRRMNTNRNSWTWLHASVGTKTAIATAKSRSTLHHDNDTPENLRRTLLQFKLNFGRTPPMSVADKKTGESATGSFPR